MARIAPAVAAGIFGVEFLLRAGLTKKLYRLLKPFSAATRLPAESALAFIAAFGSPTAANTMLQDFRRSGRLDDTNTVLSSLLLSLPVVTKETIAYHIPIAIPLLGFVAGGVYIAVFWMLASALLISVLIVSRKRNKGHNSDLSRIESGGSAPGGGAGKPLPSVFRDAVRAKYRFFFKITGIIAAVTFAVQFLIAAGAMDLFESFVVPIADLFDLPASLIAPMCTFVLSAVAGISYMSNLLKEGVITDYEAIVAFLAAGFIMVPVFQLRSQLPRYAGIFGFRLGGLIVALITVASLSTRAVLLALVIFSAH